MATLHLSTDAYSWSGLAEQILNFKKEERSSAYIQLSLIEERIFWAKVAGYQLSDKNKIHRITKKLHLVILPALFKRLV